ncbi:MAG: phage virion morphogenesis protein [Deltaproteobacteria bacterium]|nr:phage virion morphogenesis protein [Deltaproteobacteria bacterium]
MQIKVNIDDKEVRGLLNKLQEKTKDLTPAMQDVGEIVKRSITKNFDAGGRPKPWAKSAKGGIPLTDTARLKNSFTIRADANEATVGTNVQYAAIHQFGGKITAKNKPYLKFKVGEKWVSKKSVTIPARPFMLVQDEDWTAIKTALSRRLTGE